MWSFLARDRNLNATLWILMFFYGTITVTGKQDESEDFDFALNDRTSNFLLLLVIAITIGATFMGLKNDIYGCNLFTTFFISSIFVSFFGCLWILVASYLLYFFFMCCLFWWTLVWIRLAVDKQYLSFWLNCYGFICQNHFQQKR